jgi:hypothetical protein
MKMAALVVPLFLHILHSSASPSAVRSEIYHYQHSCEPSGWATRSEYRKERLRDKRSGSNDTHRRHRSMGLLSVATLLWRTDPLLGNDSVNTLPRKRTRYNRMSIARQRISKQVFSIIERLWFLRSLCRGFIKGQRRSFELVDVENWVNFCKWQWKVIEKKLQEMN